MLFRSALTVICLFPCVTCSAQQPATSAGINGTPKLHEAGEASARRGHGTIVVIVAAKDGYALAADSRLTLSDGRNRVVGARDDGEKLFAIGKFTACVVAGNVSSTAQGDGFVLESSVATEMATTNLLLARNAQLAQNMDAHQFATFFQTRLTVVLGLLDADVTLLGNPVFGMSAVSFRPNGDRQWVSYKQNFSVNTDFAGRKYFSPGEVLPISEPALKVVAIGAPSAMVDALITLDGPRDTIPFTTTMIMRRYFELKKAGHLDELSLLEAEQLAAGLVQNTVKYAPEAAGVGGPIDVATLFERRLSLDCSKAECCAIGSDV